MLHEVDLVYIPVKKHECFWNMNNFPMTVLQSSLDIFIQNNLDMPFMSMFAESAFCELTNVLYFILQGTRKDFLLPDRKFYVNMQTHYMQSYLHKVIEVCHRRRAHATAGMNAKVMTDNENEKAELVEAVCK